MSEKNDDDNDMLIGLNRAMFAAQEAAFKRVKLKEGFELPEEKFERKKRRKTMKSQYEIEQEKIQEKNLEAWKKEQEEKRPMTKERLIDLIEEEISYLSDTSKLGTYISEAVSGKPENLRTMIEEGHLNPLEISGVFSKIDKIKETLKGGGKHE